MKGHPQQGCGQEYRERSVPDPFEGHHDSGGEKNSHPCGGDRGGAASDLAREIVERKSGCGGEESVQEDGGKKTGDGEGSEEAKDQRQEKRIDRREASRWSGNLAEEMAETLFFRESESDVAGFLFGRDGSENFLGGFVVLVL